MVPNTLASKGKTLTQGWSPQHQTLSWGPIGGLERAKEISQRKLSISFANSIATSSPPSSPWSAHPRSHPQDRLCWAPALQAPPLGPAVLLPHRREVTDGSFQLWHPSLLKHDFVELSMHHFFLPHSPPYLPLWWNAAFSNSHKNKSALEQRSLGRILSCHKMSDRAVTAARWVAKVWEWSEVHATVQLQPSEWVLGAWFVWCLFSKQVCSAF